ncbi:hemerythrin domain-containing protein [Melioribacteraceae bacterium 4301-Me]|uniref:hemerythrin domain-containing protein n=1 Tax=Pyranulibacter aquaticus TaxID=3163344 RepID=UPI0035997018
MNIKIPVSLKLEHEELHNQLAAATKIGGKIAEAAKLVAQTLHPHFVAEEEFAIPPLGILPQLIEGKITEEMRDVIKMTDKLKSELPKMLEEHKAIVSALDNLLNVAKEENKLEYVKFAEKLKLHAKTEEEVTYPTALLIGEYLKLKFNKN